MPDILHQAVRHHQQGRLDEAARFYQAVLVVQPDHPDALHLLGVVAHQKGDHAGAAEPVGRAIAGNPGDAMYRANLAEACRALGRFEEAVASWCSLDWEPACLQFHEGNRPVRTASVSQVRQPIYRRSVARWKNYERNLGPLLAQVSEKWT
jgi:hypothetical protein